MIVDSKDLNIAYQAYKNGTIMRQDLFRVICDHILALKDIVTELQDGQSEVIAARKELADIRQQLAGLDAKIEAKVATAVNATVSMVQAMQGYGPAGDRAPIADKPRRGRPPRQAEAGEAA